MFKCINFFHANFFAYLSLHFRHQLIAHIVTLSYNSVSENGFTRYILLFLFFYFILHYIHLYRNVCLKILKWNISKLVNWLLQVATEL